MSDDEYRMREAIIRIKNRVEKNSMLKSHFDNELSAIVDDAQRDIKAIQMQLDANQVSRSLTDSDQSHKL